MAFPDFFPCCELQHMDTFSIVNCRDEEKHGEYRTKRIILETYEKKTQVVKTGNRYKSRLKPSPVDLTCCHSPGR